jgi:hypothetical protein
MADAQIGGSDQYPHVHFHDFARKAYEWCHARATVLGTGCRQCPTPSIWINFGSADSCDLANPRTRCKLQLECVSVIARRT